jgi:hypothetical protein
MSCTINGGIALSSTLMAQIAAGPNIIDPYNVPIQPSQSAQYSTGTGPNQANKPAQLADTTTISTNVDVDLSAIVCADGSTGFAHVRELVIFNLDAVHPLTVGDDGSVSYPWTPWSPTTHPQVTVPPGGNFRITKPLGTNGYPVTGGASCKIRITPGAFAIPYQVLVLGD